MPANAPPRTTSPCTSVWYGAGGFVRQSPAPKLPGIDDVALRRVDVWHRLCGDRIDDEVSDGATQGIEGDGIAADNSIVDVGLVRAVNRSTGCRCDLPECLARYEVAPCLVLENGQGQDNAVGGHMGRAVDQFLYRQIFQVCGLIGFGKLTESGTGCRQPSPVELGGPAYDIKIASVRLKTAGHLGRFPDVERCEGADHVVRHVLGGGVIEASGNDLRGGRDRAAVGRDEAGRLLAKRNNYIGTTNGVFLGEISAHACDVIRFGKPGKIQELGEEVNLAIRRFQETIPQSFSGCRRRGDPLIIGIKNENPRHPADDWNAASVVAAKESETTHKAVASKRPACCNLADHVRELIWLPQKLGKATTFSVATPSPPIPSSIAALLSDSLKGSIADDRHPVRLAFQ